MASGDYSRELNYRQYLLDTAIEELRAAVTGADYAFDGWMTDDEGIYSEKRTRRLADSLTQGVRDNREREGRPPLTPAQAAMYEDLWYCALRFGASPCPPFPETSFRSLTEWVRTDTVYPSPEALSAAWRQAPPLAADVFAPAGHPAEDFTWKMVRFAQELADAQGLTADLPELPPPAAPPEADSVSSPWDEDIPAFIREQWDAEDAAIAAFPNAREFLDSLKRFLAAQHLRGRQTDFARDAEGAVRLFLEDEGCSLLTDPEAFYRALAKIRHLSDARRLRGEVLRDQ